MRDQGAFQGEGQPFVVPKMCGLSVASVVHAHGHCHLNSAPAKQKSKERCRSDYGELYKSSFQYKPNTRTESANRKGIDRKKEEDYFSGWLRVFMHEIHLT